MAEVMDLIPTRSCFTPECSKAGVWIPHIRVLPPNKLPGPSLILCLSIMLCDACKEQASLGKYISDQDWDLLASLHTFGPTDNSGPALPIDQRDATMVFHTMEETVAYLEAFNAPAH